MAPYSWDEVLEIVKAKISEVLPEHNGRSIGPDDLLDDLGANSLDRAEILTLSVEALGIVMPLSEVEDSASVGELVEALHVASSRS